jgi:hypothetical protein
MIRQRVAVLCSPAVAWEDCSVRLFGIAVLMGALVIGCSSDSTNVRSDSDDGGRTTTTCVSAPATTAYGMKGGGEIVCGPSGGTTDSTPVTTLPSGSNS